MVAPILFRADLDPRLAGLALLERVTQSYVELLVRAFQGAALKSALHLLVKN